MAKASSYLLVDLAPIKQIVAARHVHCGRCSQYLWWGDEWYTMWVSSNGRNRSSSLKNDFLQALHCSIVVSLLAFRTSLICIHWIGMREIRWQQLDGRLTK